MRTKARPQEEPLMKTQIYSIYDTASATYQKPTFARTDGEIMREFQNICMDKQHPCGQHPEDYSLIRLGNYDDQNGKVINEVNECLATGLEMVALHRSKSNTGEKKAGTTTEHRP